MSSEREGNMFCVILLTARVNTKVARYETNLNKATAMEANKPNGDVRFCQFHKHGKTRPTHLTARGRHQDVTPGRGDFSKYKYVDFSCEIGEKHYQQHHRTKLQRHEFKSFAQNHTT